VRCGVGVNGLPENRAAHVPRNPVCDLWEVVLELSGVWRMQWGCADMSAEEIELVKYIFNGIGTLIALYVICKYCF
jgi:hypothetical protein